MKYVFDRSGLVHASRWRALGLGLACCLASGPAGAFVPVDGVPWDFAATDSRAINGEAVTLTWGFVADGTQVNDGATSLGGSDLIATFNTAFGSNAAESDLTQQPWFDFFADSYGRWAEVSGLTFVYEPNDTGQAVGSVSGLAGVRPDLRIGGAGIDGGSSTLAFNFLPDNGDMVLDTDDIGFFDNPDNNFVALRNVIMHEAGHGLGFNHVESDTDALLLEPVINLSFDGPQLDDIRGIQFFYGDAFEKTNDGRGNNTAADALGLGTALSGTTLSIGTDADVPTQAISADATDFVSIANQADIDFFSFTVGSAGSLSVDLQPLGGTFNQGVQDGPAPTPFNASARADLLFTVFDQDGTTALATVDATVAGAAESFAFLELDEAGEYFVSVATTDDTVQLYRLDIAFNELIVDIFPGDFNGDGFVSQADLDLVLLNWGESVVPPEWVAVDQFDGVQVSQNELDGVLLNWGDGTPPGSLIAAAVIPEPTAAAVWVAGVGLFARRTRRLARVG